MGISRELTSRDIEEETLVITEEQDRSLSGGPGLWPENLTDSDSKKIVCKLATREADLTKQLLKDQNRRPFPDYLLYTDRSTNERQKLL